MTLAAHFLPQIIVGINFLVRPTTPVDKDSFQAGHSKCSDVVSQKLVSDQTVLWKMKMLNNLGMLTEFSLPLDKVKDLTVDQAVFLPGPLSLVSPHLGHLPLDATSSKRTFLTTWYKLACFFYYSLPYNLGKILCIYMFTVVSQVLYKEQKTCFLFLCARYIVQDELITQKISMTGAEIWMVNISQLYWFCDFNEF